MFSINSIKVTDVGTSYASAILLNHLMTFTQLTYFLYFFQLCCEGGAFFGPTFNYTQPMLLNGGHRTCTYPQYIYLSGIMGYLTVAIFIRLASIVKLFMWFIIGALYVCLLYTSPSPRD